jgi:hypothetical protein
VVVVVVVVVVVETNIEIMVRSGYQANGAGVKRVHDGFTKSRPLRSMPGR